MIHGGMGREDRLKAQESFRHDPHVQVLLAPPPAPRTGRPAAARAPAPRSPSGADHPPKRRWWQRPLGGLALAMAGVEDDAVLGAARVRRHQLATVADLDLARAAVDLNLAAAHPLLSPYATKVD